LNFDEARVILASADSEGKGYLDLGSFMDLLYSNVNIKASLNKIKNINNKNLLTV